MVVMLKRVNMRGLQVYMKGAALQPTNWQSSESKVVEERLRHFSL
jgi:hypothetical protein